MKKFWAIATVVLAVIFITPDADARRLGGGKSFGSSFKTAPSQPKTLTADSGKTATGAASQPAGARKGGLLGGVFGGLLAGGLIAALLGGAFEGIQLMDILLIGGLAFVLFRLLRGARRQTPAYAASGSPQPSAYQSTPSPAGWGASGGSTAEAAAIPFHLPPGFDLPAFLNGAREHYRILQQAWNDNDLEKIREYVSPALFEQLQQERRSLEQAPHTTVLYLDVELVRAESYPTLAQVSLKFSGRCRDEATGEEEAIEDIWHLQRELDQPNAPWHVVGIEG